MRGASDGFGGGVLAESVWLDNPVMLGEIDRSRNEVRGFVWRSFVESLAGFDEELSQGHAILR
jgi:hypothetical protein